MKPILALSTAWCSHRHSDGYAMLEEMAGLGFAYVELSHGIRLSLVPGLLRAVEAGVVKVGSLHNICPLPAGVTQAAPNVFQPSALDTREHEQWIRHTRRSIDFATRVNAGVLVCHLGSVGFFWFNPVRRLLRFLEKRGLAAAPAEDAEYQAERKTALAKLHRRRGPYWERTQAGVREVLGYAGQKGVRLGFENREKFEELPLDADFPSFLGGLPAGASAGYWHDVGHAWIKENLGLIDHRRQLEENAPRLIGFHLHDVIDGHDHQPIGTGSVDFGMVSGFWRPEHRLVLELGPETTRDEVLASKGRVEEMLGKL